MVRYAARKRAGAGREHTPPHAPSIVDISRSMCQAPLAVPLPERYTPAQGAGRSAGPWKLAAGELCLRGGSRLSCCCAWAWSTAPRQLHWAAQIWKYAFARYCSHIAR